MLRWTPFVFAAGLFFASSSAMAETSSTDNAKENRYLEAPSDVNVTPEMWLYLHEYRRYNDPHEMVRRNAEQRGAERRARLAAQRWFGFSNLRPTANPIPWYATFSPHWSGNSWDPQRWIGFGGQTYFYHRP